VGQHCDVEVVGIARLMAPLSSEQINCYPSGDRMQPWSWITLQVEPARSSPRLQKRLLDGFLGEATIAERSIGNGEDRPTIVLVDGADGSGISVPKPSHHP
jgi:hypothetical protein